MKRLAVIAVILHVSALASQAEGQTCTFPSDATEIGVYGTGGDYVAAVGAWKLGYDYTGCATVAETWVYGLAENQKYCQEGSLVSGACRDSETEAKAQSDQKSHSVVPWNRWDAQANFKTLILGTTSQVAHGPKSGSINFGPRPPTEQEECEGYDGHPPLGIWENGMCNYFTPIIIPTVRGEVWKLTTPEDGVLFDLDGDGFVEQVSWTRPGSYLAFLAIDRDGDGQITSGAELLGNHTVAGVATGFEALEAVLPHTGDGSIDTDDPIYPHLLLWTDRNHNGISEPTELQPASRLVTKIGLGYFDSKHMDENGNVFLVRGWAEVRTAPGRNESRSAAEHRSRLISIYDVVFRVLQ